MLAINKPAEFEGVNFTAELADAGRGDVFFYTDGDQLIFQEDDDMREWLISLLSKHDPTPRPTAPTPEQTRLAALEKWAISVNESVDALIFDALLASLSDEDLLADLGGL